MITPRWIVFEELAPTNEWFEWANIANVVFVEDEPPMGALCVRMNGPHARFVFRKIIEVCRK